MTEAFRYVSFVVGFGLASLTGLFTLAAGQDFLSKFLDRMFNRFGDRAIIFAMGVVVIVTATALFACTASPKPLQPALTIESR